jgi:Fur family transcriptional regulator, iron response regulator
MLEIIENLEKIDATSTFLELSGVKPTRQRLDIARILLARHQHLCADQVMALVNQSGSELSKATVYNTLKLFVEKQLIREVIVDPEKVFYDSNIAPHHHFYDVETGEIIDIDAANVEVVGLPPLPEGRITEGVDVVVRMRRESSV